MRVFQFEKDFSDIAIRGRQAGKYSHEGRSAPHFAQTKRGSTLGGRKVWFDPDVLRLNYDAEGTYLGEFQGEDKILVVKKTGIIIPAISI